MPALYALSPTPHVRAVLSWRLCAHPLAFAQAYELSVLTGTDILLMIASETGKIDYFVTPKLRPLVGDTGGELFAWPGLACVRVVFIRPWPHSLRCWVAYAPPELCWHQCSTCWVCACMVCTYTRARAHPATLEWCKACGRGSTQELIEACLQSSPDVDGATDESHLDATAAPMEVTTKPNTVPPGHTHERAGKRPRTASMIVSHPPVASPFVSTMPAIIPMSLSSMSATATATTGAGGPPYLPFPSTQLLQHQMQQQMGAGRSTHVTVFYKMPL